MGYYLYDHQNSNAPVRANGKRFWGYPSRNASVQLIAVHTAESVFDTSGADSGAEAVAGYQSRTDRPSSYHTLVDRDSTIDTLPDTATSFGVVGYNSRALNLSFAMSAADWGNAAKAKAAEPMLHRAAKKAAEWCKKYDIPVRLITKAQADAGVKGLTSHGRLDPSRRSDPGLHFPWDRFLMLVRSYLGSPSTTTPEDDMTPEQEKKLDLALTRLDYVANKAMQTVLARTNYVANQAIPFLVNEVAEIRAKQAAAGTQQGGDVDAAARAAVREFAERFEAATRPDSEPQS